MRCEIITNSRTAANYSGGSSQLRQHTEDWHSDSIMCSTQPQGSHRSQIADSVCQYRISRDGRVCLSVRSTNNWIYFVLCFLSIPIIDNDTGHYNFFIYFYPSFLILIQSCNSYIVINCIKYEHAKFLLLLEIHERGLCLIGPFSLSWFLPIMLLNLTKSRGLVSYSCSIPLSILLCIFVCCCWQ